jgi:NAD dependent epimerase/dehydratase family enzyme
MKETVLITGANGFVARELIRQWGERYKLKLLTRSPKASNEYGWDTEQMTIDPRALDDVDYIVHLAGAKLNDGQPMTTDKERRIYASRVGAADC